MTARRCWHCGGGTFHHDLDGERFCLICGRQALPPMSMADAARLGGVSLRTVKRWVDAGQVAGDPPTGSGRPRMVDAAAVLLLVARRSNTPARCEWDGRLIPPPGVSRGAKVSRRWCSGRCKSANHNRELAAAKATTSLTVTAPEPEVVAVVAAVAEEDASHDSAAALRLPSSDPPPERESRGAAGIVVAGVSSGTTMERPGV